MLGYIQEGDAIHAHSVDRLARSPVDLLAQARNLTAHGLHFLFHKENLLFNEEPRPTQDLMRLIR